jgi:NAD(P)H-flavin reductase
MFWIDRFKAESDELIIATDDGSFGVKGLVTGPLQEVLDRNPDLDEVLAIGPAIMMKACVAVTKPRGIKTIVSLNPVMVDGTGMCGGCRVTVGGKMAFACVDGPEFDGLQVDFDELLARAKRFDRFERESMHLFREQHDCRLPR